MRDSIFMSPTGEVNMPKEQGKVQANSAASLSEVTKLVVPADVLSLIHIIIMYLRSKDYIRRPFVEESNLRLVYQMCLYHIAVHLT